VKKVAAYLMMLMLAAGGVMAQPAGVTSAALTTAQRTPQQWAERLKAGHARVDAALKQRQQKNNGYKNAVKVRDAEAGAIEAMKKSGVSEQSLRVALQRALSLDEQAAVAQSELLAAEAEVARRGAELLGTYDALLLEKRNEAMRSAKGSDARRCAMGAFRALTDRRTQIRRALLPVLKSPTGEGAVSDVRARADDDIETLLEKADLARDLERRFMRRAESVRKRIIELEGEAAVARGVVGMVQRNQLFDETDRRLFVRGAPNAQRSNGFTSALTGGTADSVQRVNGDAPPPAGVPGTNETDDADGLEQNPNDQFNNGTDSDFDPAVGAVEVRDDGRQELDSSAGAVNANPAQPGVSSVAAERALMGALNGNAGLEELLARDSLSVKDLKRLEKKLRQRAKRMRAEKQKIRTRISEQTNR